MPEEVKPVIDDAPAGYFTDSNGDWRDKESGTYRHPLDMD